MRQLVIVIIIVCAYSFPIEVNAKDDTSVHTWKQLNQTSDRILQLVKVEEFEEAKQLLDYFSRLFLEINFQEEGLTMSALRIVTNTYEKAVEAVTATDQPLEERIYRVTSFRLAVDALSSEHHPLWLQSEGRMMHVIQAMEETIKEGDSRSFQYRFNEFIKNYEMIRPALLIDIKSEQLERIQSQIMFLEKQRNQFNQEILSSHVGLIKEEWTNLYKQVKEDATDPSLWWVMIAIGGMITLSLTYVGWKKYKAEKQKVRAKE